MRSRRLALAALAAVLVASWLGADAPAQQIPKNLPKVPDVARYKATLDVAGIVRVYRSYDTKSECRPGQKWEMTNEALLDYERTVSVIVIDNKLAPLSPPIGGVSRGKATLDSYTTSNYCPPSEPAPLKRPDCDPAGHEGKLQVALSSMPVKGYKAALTVTRIGGGSESEDCDFNSALELPDRFKLSPFDHDPSAMGFNLDLRGKSFQTLGRGKKLTRKMRFSGTCDDIKVTHGPPAPRATGDCVVLGTINFSLKRRLGG